METNNLNKYCRNCGNKLEENQKYCPKCNVEVIDNRIDVTKEIKYKNKLNKVEKKYITAILILFFMGIILSKSQSYFTKQNNMNLNMVLSVGSNLCYICCFITLIYARVNYNRSSKIKILFNIFLAIFILYNLWIAFSIITCLNICESI